MHQYAVAFNTCGSEAEAQKLARALVSQGAAACVTIIAKAMSYYKWNDKLCEEAEWLLIIKTTFAKQELIEKIFRELHSYEVPELIFLPITGGKAEYLEWLAKGLES